MFFKVFVKEKPVPAFIRISYGKTRKVKGAQQVRIAPKQTQDQSDLRVYYSAEQKEPNEENAIEHVRPRKVVLSAQMGLEFYATDWVYLSFVSEKGCTVSINVSFKDDVVATANLRRETPKELELLQKATVADNKRDVFLPEPRNIVKGNMNLQPYSPSMRHLRISSQSLQQAKLQDQAVLRRSLLDHKRQLQAQWTLVKWQNVKLKKQEMLYDLEKLKEH